MWVTKRHAKCFLAGRINPSFTKKACVSVTIRMRLEKVVGSLLRGVDEILALLLLVQER